MVSKIDRALTWCKQAVTVSRSPDVRRQKKVVVRLSALDRFHRIDPRVIDVALCAIAVALSLSSLHYYEKAGPFHGYFRTPLFALVFSSTVLFWRRLPIVTLIAGLVMSAVYGDVTLLPLASLGVGFYTNRPEMYAAISLLIFPFVRLIWSPQGVGFVFNVFVGVYVIGLPAATGVFARRKRELEQYTERKIRKLRESIAYSIRYAVTEERTRLAVEIHDGLGHQLSVLAIQAGIVQSAPGDSDAMRAAAAAIPEAAQRAVQEMHSILSSLRGITGHELSQDFAAAARLELVPVLIENLQKSGVDVEYTRKGESRDIPDEVSHLAYRVVQEGLTNAVKHATGTHIRITLEFLAHRIDVSVYNSRPEGVLLDIRSGGTGLDSLRRRLESAGGNLSALSTREGGFLLKAALPTQHLPDSPPENP